MQALMDSLQDTIIIPYYKTDPLLLITPTLSDISAVTVLFLCFATRAFRDPLQIMVIMINFVDVLLYSARISVALIPPASTLHCKILHTFTTFGTQSTVLWGAFFGHGLHMVIKNDLKYSIRYCLKYYILFATIFPLFMSIGVTMFANYVQYSDNFGCYHEIQQGSLDYVSLCCRIFPMSLAVFLSIYWYSKTIFKVRAAIEREYGDATGIKMLAIFPAILLLCWVPSGVTTVMQALGMKVADSIHFAVWSLAHLQGFFNALTYGGGVKNVAKKFFMVVCRCDCRDVQALKGSTLGESVYSKAKNSSVFMPRTISDNEVLV